MSPKRQTRHGGLEVWQARRLTPLDRENGKRKTRLAEAMLETPPSGMSRHKNGSTRRRAGHGGCHRRDARGEPVLAVDRSRLPSQSPRSDDPTARAVMTAAAAERRRFGFRRTPNLRERQGA